MWAKWLHLRFAANEAQENQNGVWGGGFGGGTMYTAQEEFYFLGAVMLLCDFFLQNFVLFLSEYMNRREYTF